MSQEEATGINQEAANISQETPPEDAFIAPSIQKDPIISGESYTYFSKIPEVVRQEKDTECVLGVDEAGRGPVLGPMVYSLFYLPAKDEKPLLTEAHKFNDSKALTPQVRSDLMRHLCASGSDLYKTCGWATRVMSAADISAGMLRSSGAYNLNNQAMDATIDLIQAICDQSVNVKKIFIDTIGKPEVYQKKLELIFPTQQITVAKKADSLYPCVSAASVCAKVTRDAALEVSYEAYRQKSSTQPEEDMSSGVAVEGWGSGYPADARCSNWLDRHMDPFFGWGSECRFSWDTAKSRLEATAACSVDWPEPDDTDDSMKLISFFGANTDDMWQRRGELATWFGVPATDVAF